MSVKDHISNLEHQTKIIYYINEIVNSEDFLKSSLIPKKDENIKDEISLVVKSYLKDYLQSIIEKTSFDITFLTQEDILIVKQLVSAIKGKTQETLKPSNLNSPKATSGFIEPVKTGDSRAVFTNKEATIPYRDDDNIVGRIVSLLDITTITDRYGSSVENVYDKMKIKILRENAQGFEACIADRPSFIFDVPRECIEI